MRLFRWKHIEDLDAPGDIYLSRLMLIKTRWFGVYFHIIRRPDWARCEHSHPWPFLTVILRGGYEEEARGTVAVLRPGDVAWRGKNFEHKITRLRGKTAWTLVFRGRDGIDWGFRTKNGHVRWQDYVSWESAKRVLWCDDR